MIKITEKQYQQTLQDNRDTSINIRRSEVNSGTDDLGMPTVSYDNHWRRSFNCKDFVQNEDILYNQEIDLAQFPEYKAELDALKAELQSKGWVAGSQLITDYEAWQQQQASMMP